MLLDCLRTENDLPRKRSAINNMELSVEDLAKPLAFPAKDNCTTGCEPLPIQACADNLSIDIHDIGKPEHFDDFTRYEVVLFAPGIELHFMFDVFVRVLAIDLDRPQEGVMIFLRRRQSTVPGESSYVHHDFTLFLKGRLILFHAIV